MVIIMFNKMWPEMHNLSIWEHLKFDNNSKKVVFYLEIIIMLI